MDGAPRFDSERGLVAQIACAREPSRGGPDLVIDNLAFDSQRSHGHIAFARGLDRAPRRQHQRRRACLESRHRLGDLSQFGVKADLGDDARGAPGQDRRARVQHVAAVASARTKSETLPTGIDSPVSMDSSTVTSSAVIRRASAGTRSPDCRRTMSPRHEISADDQVALGASSHHHLVGDHGVQGLGAALGLPFLKRADDRIDLERHEDEDRIRILGDAERHDGRPEKQIDQGASELTEIDRRRSSAFGAR